MKKLSNLVHIGRFFTSGETLIGAKALAGLGRLGADRVFVLVSSSVLKANQEYIDKCLSRFACHVMEAPRGEPTLPVGAQVCAAMKEFSPDIIIAIGGGSVIDLAKLAWVLFEKPEIEFSDSRTIFPVSNLRSRCSGFVAVPTTYGSGSEQSSAAVFQKTKGKAKNFVVGAELLPDIAVLDPALCLSLPISIAASGIADTLAHAIEGYVSRGSNTLVRQLAASTTSMVRIALSNQVKLDEQINDDTIVETYLTAASMAGIVQNIANPGVGHALSHYCARYGVNHGQACGYFLPVSLAYNSTQDSVKAAYTTLAIQAGFGTYEHMFDWLMNISTRFELHTHVPNQKKLRLEFDEEAFLDDPTVTSNPIAVSTHALLDIWEQVYGL